MTTPETPASVLGGPDLLTEMAARLRHRVDECGVEMTCMFDEDGCHGCTACEQDEALLDRYDREHTRPTTARDAALREEGRVQGLEEARQACKAVKAPKGEEYNYRIGHAEGVSECIQAILERKLTATPDASQGSARFTEFAAKLGPLPVSAMASGEPAPEAPPAAPQGSPLPGEKRCSKCGFGRAEDGSCACGASTQDMRHFARCPKCNGDYRQTGCFWQGCGSTWELHCKAAIPQSGDEKEGT